MRPLALAVAFVVLAPLHARAADITVYAPNIVAGPLRKLAESWTAETGNKVTFAGFNVGRVRTAVEKNDPGDVVVAPTGNFTELVLQGNVVLSGTGTLTLSNNVMSLSFHAYQAELYPTRIRALAVGFVYSWSRLSAVFGAFVIAFVLRGFGVAGVFALIAASMAVVVAAIGIFGPKVKDLTLEEISR